MGQSNAEFVQLVNRNTGKRMDVLERAFDVSYTRRLNNAWSGSFSLRHDDPKREKCVTGALIRLQDESQDYGLYRIAPQRMQIDSRGIATYELEHVITTLRDKYIMDTVIIGNLGVYTKDIIEYLLNRQEVKHWRLGVCEINQQFEHAFEKLTLLRALWSITAPFAMPFRWEYDTSSYPWVLNLRLLDMAAKPQCRLIDRYNIQSVSETVDTEQHFTRIYGRGFGEGVNQMTFASINGGKDYVEAPQTVLDRYGIIEGMLVDREMEDKTTLLETCKSALRHSMNPVRKLQVEAVDFFGKTRDEIDRPAEGKVVRIIHPRIDLDYYNVIVEDSKTGIEKQNGEISISIAENAGNIGKTLSEIKDKQIIEMVHSQGATNDCPQMIAENATPTKSIKIEFPLPEDAYVVNRVMFRWRAERYRANSTGAASGGGGYFTTSTLPTQTSMSNGMQTSYSAGAVYATTASDTQPTRTSGASSQNTTAGSWPIGSLANPVTGTPMPIGIDHYDQHHHDFTLGLINAWNSSLYQHTHAMDHNHSVPGYSHSHSLTLTGHSHDISGHTHDIAGHDHYINILAHTHATIYDIFEGQKADSATVKIDGQAVTIPQNKEVDIKDYLSKTSTGEIKRGDHVVEVFPNVPSRIVLYIRPRYFIQSRAGGAY